MHTHLLSQDAAFVIHLLHLEVLVAVGKLRPQVRLEIEKRKQQIDNIGVAKPNRV